MALSDIRLFIKQAQQYSMPTAFLTRLINDYKFDFESGTGTDHVKSGWWHHELVLYEKTWKGLSRPDFADSISVLNLYHEGTHAYIDLVDYDQTREFGEAMKHYEWAKLTNGDKVWPDVDTERAVQEAAAMYVGNRAATVWKTWARLKLLDQLVKKVSDGKLTVAKGIEIMRNTGKSTVANDYWADMSERVFGYVERDGKQVEVADRPIYYKLADYCDRVILENSISDHLVKMPALGNYIDNVYRAAQKFPELAKAMVTP